MRTLTVCIVYLGNNKVEFLRNIEKFGREPGRHKEKKKNYLVNIIDTKEP